MRRTLRRVGAAIGDVQLLRVSADGQSMRADPGGNESDLDKALAVDQEDAVRHHVGDVEDSAVRR